MFFDPGMLLAERGQGVTMPFFFAKLLPGESQHLLHHDRNLLIIDQIF